MRFFNFLVITTLAASSYLGFASSEEIKQNQVIAQQKHDSLVSLLDKITPSEFIKRGSIFRGEKTLSSVFNMSPKIIRDCYFTSDFVIHHFSEGSFINSADTNVGEGDKCIDVLTNLKKYLEEEKPRYINGDIVKVKFEIHGIFHGFAFTKYYDDKGNLSHRLYQSYRLKFNLRDWCNPSIHTIEAAPHFSQCKKKFITNYNLNPTGFQTLLLKYLEGLIYLDNHPNADKQFLNNLSAMSEVLFTCKTEPGYKPACYDSIKFWIYPIK